MKFRTQQRGASLLFILFIMAVLGYTAYIGIKLVPVYMRYNSIKTSIDAIAVEMETKNMSKPQVKDFLTRRLDTNYITLHTLQPIIENCREGKSDILIFETKKDGTSIGVAYNETVPLIANLSASMDFNYKTVIQRKKGQ